MKNLTIVFLFLLLGLFSIFVKETSKLKTVLEVISPTKFIIDLNRNNVADKNEVFCIDNIEAFSLEPTDEFLEKYSKKFNLTTNDIISLGYLAQIFSKQVIEHKKVSLKLTQKVTEECRFSNIFIDQISYNDILNESGFGIKNGQIEAKNKYKTNLENAKKLHLVIFNHHSGKFHTLDCPYGKASYDKIIIPKKQLSKNAKPCKFCHKIKDHKKYKHKKEVDIYKIPTVIQPPLSVFEGNIRVYITDFTRNLIPNNRCETIVCKEFVKLVDNAKNSIDLALYGYDEIPTITSALTRAKNRGVKIRYVYDESFNPEKTYYKSNSSIINLSEESKSDRTYSQSTSNMIMHNKFIIFDDETVYTGSMNFSRPGFSAYDVNDIIIIKSKDIANLYKAEFEQMLNGKFHLKKQKLNMKNKFLIGNSEVEVYFSPKDKQSARILELIKGAKQYIYIPTFLITHSEISNELINAKQRGVDVRVIIDANSTTTKNSKHSLLRKNGILLKTENYAGKLHAKTMIIDDKYLLSGSMNFSNSGENRNDENMLIIKNSQIAKVHKQFFLYLWTIIPNKYLKYNAHPESFESIGSCFDGIDNNFNGKIDKEEELCKKN